MLASRDESRERSRALAQLGSSPGVGLFLAHVVRIWDCLHMEPSSTEQSVSVSNSFALVLAHLNKWVLSDKELPLFISLHLMLRMGERSSL